MAYDEFLADRIRRQLKDMHVIFDELKMMGGLCFKVDNKMLCGIHIDKTSESSLLMARIGEEAYLTELNKKECLPMDFTGRPMRGYIFITEAGIDSETELNYWISLCLKFNPLAKASKPKRKKK
ncbi:TfoX/Sxy family protein [Tamlana agarivorans]|uniref:TfoX/Sxy family protein n=1 Tax=Pseudotamlana agarivorans TaxID=481183 RepID=A0ACC5UBS3_9FLAO|nr:TfoX/Sxy family protein [Tamlana agarivorans]MBU2951764.1 TfoX/Sxy family protein [Tamlana agarivorans]